MRGKMKKRFVLVFLSALFLSAPLFSAERNVSSSNYYYIQSAQEYGRSNRGYWDLPGSNPSYKKGARLNVWSLDYGADRKFKFSYAGSGYYTISAQNGSYNNSALDVKGGKNKNGRQLIVWSKHKNWNQLFKLRHVGNGRYKIYNKKGKVVCLDGRRSSNGTKVHIWDDHNGPWMEWVLINARTKQIVNPDERKSSYNTPESSTSGHGLSYYISHKNDTMIKRLVRNASYSDFRSQDRAGFKSRLTIYLDSLKWGKRVALAKDLIKSAANNRDQNAKYYIYRNIAKSRLNDNPKKNFLTRAVVNKIAKDISKVRSRERNPSSRSALKQIIRKLKG